LSRPPIRDVEADAGLGTVSRVLGNGSRVSDRTLQVAGSAADLADGKLAGVQVTVEGQPVPVVLLKQGHRIHALNGRFAHASGPLAEGTLVDGICVECPWHASRFDMRDGRVVQGPPRRGTPPSRTDSVAS
jgi:nitrite reductase/ring-hydroxylating ferredoxin subunit